MTRSPMRLTPSFGLPATQGQMCLGRGLVLVVLVCCPSALIAELPEPTNLRFQSSTTLGWDPIPGSDGYHVYQGTIAGLRSGDEGACLRGSLPTSSVSVEDSPPSRSAYFYVVSGYDPMGEGALGSLDPSPRCLSNRRVFTLTPNGDPGDGTTDGTEPRQNPSELVWTSSYGLAGVYLHSGEFFVSATDLSIPGRGLDLRLRRHYRSQIDYDGPLGHGWDFEANARLKAAGGDILYFDGTGRMEGFIRIDSTHFFSPTGQFASLTEHGDGSFTLREAEGTKRVFHALDGSNRQGALAGLEDRHGNSISMEYDSQGLLASISDASGRSITLVHDASGRLVSASDFTGRAVVYSYDSHGDLVAVRSPIVTGTPNGNDFPEGRTTAYSYSNGLADVRANHNLLSITAPQEAAAAGPPVLQNTYGGNTASFEFDRIIAQTIGGTNATGFPAGGARSFTYASLGPGRRVTVLDPNGNQQEYVHSTSGQVVQKTEVTNREIRPGEGDHVTTLSYTSDGLLASITLPRGNALSYAYDEGNPLRRSQGNRLEERHSAGGIAGGGPDLVTRYTYEPVFNQRRTITDPRAFPLGLVPLDPNGHLDLSDPLVARYSTTYLFDYQEGSGLQELEGIPLAERVPEGLGDLNGAPDFDEGNAVQRLLPEIQTPGPNFGQTSYEVLTYNAFGQIETEQDPEGHVIARDYWPATGYLRSITHDAQGLGLRREFVYDPVGNVVQEIDPKLQAAEFVFNALNEVVRRFSRPVSGATRYQTDLFFDANGNVVRVETQNIDESGAPYVHSPLVDTYGFDILDQRRAVSLDKSLNGDSSTAVVRTEYWFDGNGNRVATVRPLAVNGTVPRDLVTTLYDERDLPYKVTEGDDDIDPENPPPSGAVVTTTNYDPNRNVWERIDAIRNAQRPGAPTTLFPGSAPGDVTRHTYDGFDRRVQTLDGEGNERAMVYDLASNLVQTVWRGFVDHTPGAAFVVLRQADTVFDERNQEVVEDARHFTATTGADIGDGHRTTVYTYDRDGWTTGITDDLGRTRVTQRDTAERIEKVVDPLGNEVEYAYDVNGNVLSETRREVSSDLGSGPDSFVWSHVYDGLDRRTQSTRPDGSVTDRFYDSRGNVARTLDSVRGLGHPYGAGNAVIEEFDGLDRAVRVERVQTANGRGDSPQIDLLTTHRTWDDDSRLVAQMDDNLHATTYSYDAVGRWTAVGFADCTAAVFAYDEDSHRTAEVDPNGTTVALAYDGVDRLLSRTVMSRAPFVLGGVQEEFGYDGLGRPTHATNNDGVNPGLFTNGFEYDSLSNATRDEQGGLAVDSVHDAVGNRIQISYPGRFGGGRRVLTRSFDALARLRTITDADGPIVTLHYKGPARLERRTYGSDVAPISLLDVGYDAASRIIEMNHRTGPGTPIAHFQYGYDREGHRLFQKRVHDGSLGDVYRYDSSYRLIRTARSVPLAGVAPGMEIDPDAYGGAPDRLEYVLDGTNNRTTSTEMVNGNATTTSYNRVPGPCGGDAEVNQYTSSQVGATPPTLYTHDDNGNLTSDGARTYSYDFKNRLVEVRDQATSILISRYAHDAFDRRREKTLPAGTTRYLLDGFEVVEERDGADVVTRQYVWGRELDELLQEKTPTATYYAHEDSMGSIASLSDQTGAVVERYEYDPFGHASLPLGGGTGNAYRFHGLYFDEETGQLFMRHRNYSAHTGQFLQRDPIGIWGDTRNLGNGYGFVGNDPVNASDALGLQTQDDAESEQALQEAEDEYYRAQESFKKAEQALDDFLDKPLDPPRAHKLGERADTLDFFGNFDELEQGPPPRRPPPPPPPEEQEKIKEEMRRFIRHVTRHMDLLDAYERARARYDRARKAYEDAKKDPKKHAEKRRLEREEDERRRKEEQKDLREKLERIEEREGREREQKGVPV